VIDEPMLRAWMMESVKPATHHETLPGRWVAEPSWPSRGVTPRRLFLTDDGLRPQDGPLAARAVCSPQTVGKQAGEWCPFGRGQDQAGDQREDDERSLVFETPPLDQAVEILGAAILTLEVASDRPIANLAVRLCDVHPSGESLRVSYGIQNLTHRDGHETPAPLELRQRYRVRLQLNDTGSVFPAGHRIRLALSTTYWPMIWPAPDKATVTVFAGALDLPVRPVRDDALPPLPAPQTAPPERPTVVRPGVVRIDRIGLEQATEGKFAFDIKDDDPLSATAEMRRSETLSRDGWQVRIETHMHLSCTREAFLLRASLRAWEGTEEVCHRDWDRAIPRDLA
jgi:predicted acyl esterase